MGCPSNSSSSSTVVTFFLTPRCRTCGHATRAPLVRSLFASLFVVPPPLQVPELWAHCAYPSLKPLASWIKDYHQRIGFMRAWLVQGLPACFWLPGFFFPQVRKGTPQSERAPPRTLSVCPHPG